MKYSTKLSDTVHVMVLIAINQEKSLSSASLKKAQEQKEIHNLSNPEILYQALAHAFTGHEALWCIKKDSPCFDEAFYLSMNALLEVDSTYQDLYKEYL